jgi:hypothetical protein
VKDKETWAKIDGDYAMHGDAWTDLKFGARYKTHQSSSNNATPWWQHVESLAPFNVPIN